MTQLHDDKLKIVTLRIEESKIQRIDEFAQKMKLNRAQLVRNLISSGLDDLELMQKAGLLSMALKGRDLFELIRVSIGDDRYEVKDDKIVIDL